MPEFKDEAKDEPIEGFTVEDLVGEVIEPKTKKVLKDIQGEMTMSANVEGKTVTVAREITDESAFFYMNEEERKEFGDREVDVMVDFDGYETLNEKLPPKGLEEREKVPYKFKPKRFTKEMKKEALVEMWPSKLKQMKARLDGKGGGYE
jgi:hypothetical protein